MPARCIVAGCSNTTKDGVSLHVFPKDENLRRIWTSKVKLTRGNWKGPSDTSVICSAHFEDSDFDHGLYSLFSLKKLRRLKPDAVPIIKSNVVPHAEKKRGVRTAAEKRKKIRVSHFEVRYHTSSPNGQAPAHVTLRGYWRRIRDHDIVLSRMRGLYFGIGAIVVYRHNDGTQCHWH